MNTRQLLNVLGTPAIAWLVASLHTQTAHAQLPPGHCLYFNGTNAHVSVPHNAALNSYPMTLALWLQVEVTGLQRMVVLRRMTAEGGYSIAVTNGILSATYVKTNDLSATGTGLLEAIGTGIADGNWHHLAFVVGFQPALYVDGVKRGFGAWNGSAGACRISTNLSIGGESHPQWRSGALIDEVTLWNRELSQAEIQRLMTTPVNGATNGLVASWRFNEGSGTVTADSSGNGLAGTLEDGPAWTTFAPPDITTGGVVYTESTNASVFATVHSHALPTRAWFEWGPAPGYGQTTAPADLRGRHVADPIGASLGPLVFGRYHYRAVASNILGQAVGEAQMLDTTIRTVNTTLDSGPGSLRYLLSNSLPETTIRFGITGTIPLTSGELVIDRNLNIAGPGAHQLAISGSFTSRVFNILTGATVRIADLTIRNGRTPDGIDSTNNQGATFSLSGGGIKNAGILTLESCVISNNATGRGGNGYDSSLGVGGSGGWSGGGGGILNSGTLLLDSCTVARNATGRGGIGGAGSSCSFVEPGCIPAEGGPGGNSGYGGGIYNFSTGILELRACTISGNVVGMGGNGGQGGSVSLAGGARGGHGGGGGSGGGIMNFGTLTLDRCTLSGNQAGNGGSGGAGGGISGNTGAGGGGGSGGGVWTGYNLFAQSCTVVSNTAGRGASSGWHGFAGGIKAPDDWAGPRLFNTIVSDNAGFFDGNDVAGDFQSLGHNLIGNNNGSAGFRNGVNGDIVGTWRAPTNALLGPLARNNGPIPTWTHAPLPGSPVIDAGARFGVPMTDQRGLPRVVCCWSDIGAFETQSCTDCLSPAVITSLTIASDGMRRLEFNGFSGMTFTLQVSTNLMHWSDLTNLVANDHGWFEYGDPASGLGPQRFYRVKKP